MIWQPYSEKVGAGTMNPATVISVLGPEPWNVGYAEPSYRPDDGRFGENPNRMQMHTQYQVILKPDPGNPQELYLESLRAIGIDTDEHDIRFVEDNWESPALGAWGLGWEVWLDGMEITQFTYFQQAASHVLDTPAVEITYGLERIAMFLQGVRRVWDLRYDDQLSYGEVLLQPEIDHCRYDFEVAGVDRLLKLYQLYEEEARECINAGLVVPAHDCVLRCSHTFNVLDARGAIGVTERAAYFAKMRELSRLVAEIYLKQREEKGFPLLAKLPPLQEPELPEFGKGPQQAADFVLEVGVEELPPDELLSAISQLENSFKSLLKDHRLEHESLWVSGTPRRLVVFVKNLAARQPDRTVEVKGPPANKAFDESGKPTQTALGFAKSNGIDPAALSVKTEGNRSYVVAQKHEAGQAAGQVLSGLLSKVVSAIKFRKSMRWDRSGANFSRPVRWLVALHGDDVVPFRFANLVSGRVTRGPRPLNSEPITLATAGSFLSELEKCGVIVDREQRKKKIRRDIETCAAQGGGHIECDEHLLDEVTDLVECPVPVLGHFEKERLHLPAPVLTTVMKKHQRYFPVVNKDKGFLMNAFVAVSNGQRGDMKKVRQGNEDVLRARYADADFFVKDDMSHKLETFLPRLSTLTFQEKLGSMLDKSKRMMELVTQLGPAFGLESRALEQARRVAQLCKADLVTSMVVEMTSLQGVLGEIYALHSGESEEIAEAIREHYLPRYAGDHTPSEPLGRIVGLADRLDSLAGLFSVGLKPTGSADPYGLRRTAVGLIALLVEGKQRFDLKDGLARAAKLQPGNADPDTVVRDCMGFIADRLSVWLKEHGFRHDVVEAVVAERSQDPYGAFLAVQQLSKGLQLENWSFVLASYSRCKRITKDLKETVSLAPEHYTEDVSRDLYQSLSTLPKAGEAGVLLEQLVALAPKIQAFFDGVLVNAEDPAVRQARLALVRKVADLTAGVADFSKLEGY